MRKKTFIYFILVLFTVMFTAMVCACRVSDEDPALNAEPLYSQPAPTLSPFAEIDERGNIELAPWKIEAIEPFTERLSEKPTALVYHTHVTEAYYRDDSFGYEETEKWRTLDGEYNMARVGRALAAALRAEGFTVYHDEAHVEEPDLNTAYSRSLEVMSRYEGVDVYIDLHRNAGNVKTQRDDVAVVDGKRCARIFFVVGTGIGSYEGEYNELPVWEKNYAFAQAVLSRLENTRSGLTRPTRVKIGRYNQHLGLSLLVEMGHNANTLEEALNSVPYLARAIAEAAGV